MNKNLLITGGTGYLGSNLIESLLEQNYQISVLVRTSSLLTRLDSIKRQINLVLIDNLEVFFEDNLIDGIIHTATSYGRKGEPVNEILNSNLTFPLRLLKLAIEKEVKFFINTDTSLPKNLNSYSLSKFQFKDWLKYFSSNIKIINVIPEYFYGPFDDNTKFVTSILNKLNKKVDFIDFTDGLQERDFIYIEDVVDAYNMILDKFESFENYTDISLGTSVTIKLRELAELIKKTSGNQVTELNFGKIASRKGDVMYSSADLTFLKSLGWNPKFSIEEGLKKIIETEKNINNENYFRF